MPSTCDPARDPYTQPLCASFAKSWLVEPTGTPQPSASLFAPDGQLPNNDPFSLEHFPTAYTPVPKLDPAKARAACAQAGVAIFPDLDNCTLDVSATDDDRIASSYVAAARDTPGTEPGTQRPGSDPQGTDPPPGSPDDSGPSPAVVIGVVSLALVVLAIMLIAIALRRRHHRPSPQNRIVDKGTGQIWVWPPP